MYILSSTWYQQEADHPSFLELYLPFNMEPKKYQECPDVMIEGNTEYCLPFRWHSRVN